ncbi:c-type cytochrome biogenesis protein CcmI [Pseudomonas otitidis]|uniref:C-type cytochrome biogenesis protein CcmI n=1 Tax=Metapseudomonas otitidis TaxID=319939 RepID=A0ABU3XXC3_9GAMM|nr:c-type cytochrome biogenesis protein CcmI [Pseudomonas otitidis]MDV3442389.1 c-type cytochrome biogenesis protein CcmI [Pseudomonas otitidis]MEE1895196.1 c-type cytochrome biogenesis protein CcmI [Pseudomonas otitidis]WMR32129.1 c-type cytochrome biogenesis protein CcmI [Pseudomonas otitidis]
MIDFWLAAGLLLLVALAFLLIPVLRGRKAQAEEDRTALNVALYQERLAELQAQHEAGTLTEAQLEAGRAEAARELLADTEGAAADRSARLGRALPLLAALLVPALGLGLYAHWGSSDKVQLAREMREQPRTIEEMTARLEKAVQAQPDSAEGWYFLGRTYMAQERPVDAAKAYERAVQIAGRQPELLGQWAQALYFASQKRFTPEVQTLTEDALKADPNEVTSLGLLGIAGFEEGRFKDAIGYWERLIAVLPQDDPSRAALQGGIDRARERLAESGETLPERETLTKSMPQLKVRVDLAAALKDKVQPGDTVFIFARAAEGPPMPLAVKRLTVKDLPAEVVLSDADAMMPQLKISNFPQVQLVARVSREGNAKSGEWIGRGPALSSATEDPQQLTIDSPDQP